MQIEALEPVLNRAVEKGLTALVYAGDTEYALSETEWTRVRKSAGRNCPYSGSLKHLLIVCIISYSKHILYINAANFTES